MESKICSFVGFIKQHPHIDESIIRIAFNNEVDISDILKYINDSIEELIKIYTKINEEFSGSKENYSSIKKLEEITKSNIEEETKQFEPEKSEETEDDEEEPIEDDAETEEELEDYEYETEGEHADGEGMNIQTKGSYLLSKGTRDVDSGLPPPPPLL